MINFLEQFISSDVNKNIEFHTFVDHQDSDEEKYNKIFSQINKDLGINLLSNLQNLLKSTDNKQKTTIYVNTVNNSSKNEK